MRRGKELVALRQNAAVAHPDTSLVKSSQKLSGGARHIIEFNTRMEIMFALGCLCADDTVIKQYIDCDAIILTSYCIA